MKVLREISTNEFKVNDTISFTLKNGQMYHAIAVKEDIDGMLFIFKTCIDDYAYPMDDSDDFVDRYNASQLRIILNNDIIAQFPKHIISMMIPVYNTDSYHSDLLRIPTEEEIYGINLVGEKEFGDQFEIMKNNIDMQIGNCEVGYWLLNKSRTNESKACFVSYTGLVKTNPVTSKWQIRPVFKLRNPIRKDS